MSRYTCQVSARSSRSAVRGSAGHFAGDHKHVILERQWEMRVPSAQRLSSSQTNHLTLCCCSRAYSRICNRRGTPMCSLSAKWLWTVAQYVASPHLLSARSVANMQAASASATCRELRSAVCSWSSSEALVPEWRCFCSPAGDALFVCVTATSPN